MPAGPDDAVSAEQPAADPPVAADSLTAPEIVAALRAVERQAQAFHARAQNYEDIVQQMQSRIERLQGDQIQALLRPLIQRIATLHAQAAEAAQAARQRGETAEKDLSYFAVAIEEALGLLDIESVAAAPLVRFDAKRHHALRAVSTDDPDQDGHIHRVLRQGFTYMGATRVFLPAQVSIYRYEPPVVDASADTDLARERGEGASLD